MIKEPFILLSFVNTKLRDEYSSFKDFVLGENVSESEILEILESVGYYYDDEQNAFLRR